MGRKARHNREHITSAALELVAGGGPEAATIQAIAELSGAPTGSIYHRYPSRELLFADLWLSVVESFQRDFLPFFVRDGDPVRAGLDAMKHTTSWVRRHPMESRILLLYRKEDFVRGEWPPQIHDRAARANRDLSDTLHDYTLRLCGDTTSSSLRGVRFAIDIAYGAVKRYVEAGKPPPADIDDLIEKACGAVLNDIRKE